MGHSEFVYHRAVESELRLQNIHYESEKRVVVSYVDSQGNKHSLAEERIDLFIENKLIVELKAIRNVPRIHEVAQVEKYYQQLNLMDIYAEAGIIINFPQPSTTGDKRELVDVVQCTF